MRFRRFVGRKLISCREAPVLGPWPALQSGIDDNASATVAAEAG
jgi:hypothetical protein